MPPEQESTNSEAGFGDFSLAELAQALPSEDLSPEYLATIQGTTKEEIKQTDSETGEVPAEEPEAVVVEEEAKEEAPETKEEEVKEEEEDELPKSVQKRIDKLTAEKYAAKDELEKAKAEITALQTKIQNAPVQTVQVPANVPLSDINDAQTLSLRENQAKAVKRFCMQNPDGGIVKGTDDKGQPTETMLSSERVRELLVQADELLTEQIPLRRNYLQQHAQFSEEAKKEYPALFINGSEEGQLAVQFLGLAPWVKQFPDWPMVLGDYVTGYKARLNKAKAAKAPSKPVPVVKPLGSPKPAAGGTKVSVSSRNLKSVISDRQGSISVDDAADLLSGFLN